jgi:hypothetical protein
VLNVTIQDASVASLLTQAQADALSGAIYLATTEDRTARNMRIEELKRVDIENTDLTSAKQSEVAVATIGRELQSKLANITAEREATEQQRQTAELELAMMRVRTEQEIELHRMREEDRLTLLTAETTEYIRRIEAVSPELAAAIRNFGDQTFVEKLVEAIGPAAIATGITTADMFKQIFSGTPFEGVLDALTTRPLALN